MNANGFQEHELVSRRVKVGNEWQTRTFPVVGGRLRILHENNDTLSIQTEIIRLENDFAVVKANVESRKGKFNGTGTASAQRDARLIDSLVELAETRAIARALRFGGIGVEFTSAEEVSHVPSCGADADRTSGKEPQRMFPDGNGNDESKPSNTGNDTTTGEEAKNPNPDIGRASTAQIRALHALTRRARYCQEDIANLLAPFNVSDFQYLPREAASRLISHLQTEVAA